MKKFELGPIQKKWIQSLKDHPERQMKEVLGKKYKDGSYKACCLGELGIIAGICGFDGSGFLIEKDSDEDKYQLTNSYGEVGLRSAVGDPDLEETHYSLAGMNDDEFSWPEIAAIVEANPEEYFTHAV